MTDRLASLGDPPTKLRLELVRFRLEGIDTGWKVVSAKRVLPGGVKPKPAESLVTPRSQNPSLPSPGETPAIVGRSGRVAAELARPSFGTIQ